MKAGQDYKYDTTEEVWYRDKQAPFSYSDGDEAEEYLLEVFQSSKDNCCASDELPGYIRDWPSEYHLSPTRYNILRGLKLDSSQNVLEIGAGCGAVTRYLGESVATVWALEGSRRRCRIAARRCKGLSNVHICNDNFQNYKGNGKYDIATLIGVLEYAPSYFGGSDPGGRCLKQAYDHLKDGGVLIVGIENRFGLKYFNGCTEDHTNRHFDSINDLYPANTCETFGRKELSDKIQNAGFRKCEYIYPFPDYKLPKVLVRDNALGCPELDVGEIVSQYTARDYIHRYRELFSGRLAWPIIAQNGLLRHLANSFLVIAHKGGDNGNVIIGDWLLKTYTTDRRSGYRMENTFTQGKNREIRVRKRLLHIGEAANGPLINRGNISETYKKGEIFSKRLQQLTFEDNAYPKYLEYLTSYLEVLREHADKQENSDECGFSEFMPPEYYDCIPCNLVLGEDGGLEYIDQEWSFTGPLPLQYVLFRGIIHDLTRVSFFGSLRLFEHAESIELFIKKVFADLNIPITEKQKLYFIENEKRVLKQLLVQGDSENIIYKLGKAPSEVFQTVVDLNGQEKALADAQSLEQELHECRKVRIALEQSYSFRVGRIIVRTVGIPFRFLKKWIT